VHYFVIWYDINTILRNQLNSVILAIFI